MSIEETKTRSRKDPREPLWQRLTLGRVLLGLFLCSFVIGLITGSALSRNYSDRATAPKAIREHVREHLEARLNGFVNSGNRAEPSFELSFVCGIQRFSWSNTAPTQVSPHQLPDAESGGVRVHRKWLSPTDSLGILGFAGLTLKDTGSTTYGLVANATHTTKIKYVSAFVLSIVSGFYLGFALTYENDPKCGADIFNEQLQSVAFWQGVFDSIPHSIPKATPQTREPWRSPFDSAMDDPVILLGTIGSISSLKETTSEYQVVQIGSIQELRGMAEWSTVLYDPSRIGQLPANSKVFMFITFQGLFPVLDHTEPLAAAEQVYNCLATPRSPHFCSPGSGLKLWSEYKCGARDHINGAEPINERPSEWQLTLTRGGDYSSSLGNGRFTVELPDKLNHITCAEALMLVFHTGPLADKKMPVCDSFSKVVDLPELWEPTRYSFVRRRPVQCVRAEVQDNLGQHKSEGKPQQEGRPRR